MSEEFKAKVKIRPKISILIKQEVGFAFDEKLQVTLNWNNDTDLDLCVFYKTKNGQIGGAFSNRFRGRKSDLGDLAKFPFIKHFGDDPGGIKAEGVESQEVVRMANISDMEAVYLCILNYTAAIEESTVTFYEHSGKLELLSDTGDNLEISVDSKEEGQVYYIGKITKDGESYILYNEGKVMDLGDAFDEIPGFSLITKS